jgi:hypothetical protein
MVLVSLRQLNSFFEHLMYVDFIMANLLNNLIDGMLEFLREFQSASGEFVLFLLLYDDFLFLLVPAHFL